MPMLASSLTACATLAVDRAVLPPIYPTYSMWSKLLQEANANLEEQTLKAQNAVAATDTNDSGSSTKVGASAPIRLPLFFLLLF